MATPTTTETPDHITLTRGMCLLNTVDRYDGTGILVRVRAAGTKCAVVEGRAVILRDGEPTWNTKGMRWESDFAKSADWIAITEDAANEYVTRREALFIAHECPRSRGFSNEGYMAYHRAHLALIAELAAA